MPSSDTASPPPRSSTLSAILPSHLDSSRSTTKPDGRSNSEDLTGNGGLRSSMDGALGRVMRRARKKTGDDRRGSNDSGKRLSRLVPRSRSRLRTSTSNDAERQSSIDSAERHQSLGGNRSDSSLGQDGSGRSSLLTEDPSDIEERPVRPSISPHQSHVGLLTLSSPELQAQSHPSLDEASSVPSAPPVVHSSSTPSIPRIVEPSDAEPLSDSPQSLVQRHSFPNHGASDSAGDESRGSSAKQEADSASGSGPQTPPQRDRPRITIAPAPETPTCSTEAPTTLVTPPTPTDSNAEAARFAKRNRGGSISSVESIRRRRAQSGSTPSKLSQSFPPPLTPTVEESKTPGGTLTQPAGGSGFFSTFFTAAQKAADQLSNTINVPGTAGPKSKQNQPSAVAHSEEEVIPGTASQSPNDGADGDCRQPAVDTLGRGDLNFEHLGISADPSAMAAGGEMQSSTTTLVEDEKKKVEEDAAARAVSQAYEKPPMAAGMSSAVSLSRPMSLASNDRLTLTGEQSPTRSGTDGDGQRRAGSVRSKLSGRRRRHRASSATNGTGNTNSIAAGLNASTTGFSNFAGSGGGNRLTGFAVASVRRNRDFHQLFRSVPEDDYLIEDYSAALQRDILLHGRLYVSEGHICFSSNILGWVTNLVINFDEVVSIEKKSTAVIFPNAIVIQTLQARNTFASFVARDSTYELLIGIWKISHPNLKSSLNGVTLDDAGTGDKTEVADPEAFEAGVASASDDEVYDEDDDDDVDSFADTGLAPSIGGSDIGDNALSRKPSAAFVANGAAPINGAAPEGADAGAGGAASAPDFPGPAAHEVSQCSDEHYDRPLTDTTIPAPVGKVYSLMFGPQSGGFMRKWLIDDQKSRELSMVDDKIGIDNEHKSVTFDYIKPLYGGPVGPKQTKCITTNTLMTFDLDKAVTVDCSTQTPDVPSGSVFTTKTRYCLMWGPGNSTRLVATCTIEWTGKSWLKSAIDKGANDGQIEYVKAIVAALKAAVSAKTPPPGSKPAGRKGKKRAKKEVLDSDAATTSKESSGAKEQQPSDWGLLEPLHQLLQPLIAIFSPFINSQVIIAVLFVLLLYTWINPPAGGPAGVGLSGHTSAQRLAAYEEVWRREESGLWEWLEDRVGLDGIYAPGEGQRAERQKVLAARGMGKKLEAEGKMSERQMDDAIRVTEERLAALKEAVGQKKSDGKGAGEGR